MPRVRITQNSGGYRKGQIVDVTPNVAHGLIEKGVAIISKDITESDTRTKSGGSRSPRTNPSS